MYVLVCGAVALHAVLPHAEMTYASGVPVLAHGKVLFPVYHPAYILRSRQALTGWERELRIFAGMVNDPTITVSDAQALTYHCLYCNAEHQPRKLTCDKHEKWLRQDQHRTMPKPRMIEDRLFK